VLAALDSRRGELEVLIAQGETALGGARPPATPQTAMTLHQALEQVLREGGNAPMTARALTDAVNDRGLYRKRDGSPVEVNQVHARTSNYQALFDKDGPMIRLKEEPPVLADPPPGITVFQDDDRGFFSWLDDHPDSYFINSERAPKPTYLVLHRHDCSHFDRGTTVHWTKDYIKICCSDRSGLEEWATGTVGGDVTLCRTCFG
jgi:hypothetical protein